jgi:hypothetical protein
MAKLTDTQLVILSTASRRNDRGVDLPTNVTGEALREAVDRLIRAGLLEEVRANGSLLAWRRDAEAGPMALRITKQGLEASRRPPNTFREPCSAHRLNRPRAPLAHELIADPTANTESIATRECCSVRKVNMTISRSTCH